MEQLGPDTLMALDNPGRSLNVNQGDRVFIVVDKEIRAHVAAWETERAYLRGYQDGNALVHKQLDEARRRIEALEGAIDMLPCLEKADENGKGIVPVPEWVVADIAKTRAALALEEKP